MIYYSFPDQSMAHHPLAFNKMSPYPHLLRTEPGTLLQSNREVRAMPGILLSCTVPK